MTCTVCPNCGADLADLRAFTLGKLFVDNGGSHIWWNERPVRLTSSEKLIVAALARADGVPLKRHVLAEIVGYEGDHPDNIVAVYLTRIHQRFHAVDPTFDRIENVRLRGLRWKVDAS